MCARWHAEGQHAVDGTVVQPAFVLVPAEERLVFLQPALEVREVGGGETEGAPGRQSASCMGHASGTRLRCGILTSRGRSARLYQPCAVVRCSTLDRPDCVASSSAKEAARVAAGGRACRTRRRCWAAWPGPGAVCSDPMAPTLIRRGARRGQSAATAMCPPAGVGGCSAEVSRRDDGKWQTRGIVSPVTRRRSHRGLRRAK